VAGMDALRIKYRRKKRKEKKEKSYRRVDWSKFQAS
jgi:hypothetical protein